MSLNFYTLRYFSLPAALSCVTVIVTLFAQQSRDWLLPVLFLLLPFTDYMWRIPRLKRENRFHVIWAILAAVTIALLLLHPDILSIFTVMVFFAALPEEWFFRAYLQKRFGNSMAAVLIVSLLFSSMHFIAYRSAVAWLVFIPSVFFGWIYKKTDDLILVVIIHALSNLVYYIHLKPHFIVIFG